MAERGGPDRWFFDLWSRFYDAPLVQRLTYRPEQDAVLRALQRGGQRRVLDVGCGTGLLTSRLARTLHDASVVGCDFSRGMLERAAARSPRMGWVRGNALALPFAPGTFEAVISTEAFHWFPDPAEALREFHRVLEPKGRILIAVINPPHEALSLLTQRASQLVGEPLFWPTRALMREWVEAAGFRVEAQQRILRLPATFILPTVLTVATREG